MHSCTQLDFISKLFSPKTMRPQVFLWIAQNARNKKWEALLLVTCDSKEWKGYVLVAWTWKFMANFLPSLFSTHVVFLFAENLVWNKLVRIKFHHRKTIANKQRANVSNISCVIPFQWKYLILMNLFWYKILLFHLLTNLAPQFL